MMQHQTWLETDGETRRKLADGFLRDAAGSIAHGAGGAGSGSGNRRGATPSAGGGKVTGRYFPPEWVSHLLELRKARRIGWRTVGVGLALASFSNSRRTCWPSVAALVERSGVSGRHVSAELSRLEAVGALERTVNRGKVSRFKLVPPLTETVRGG